MWFFNSHTLSQRDNLITFKKIDGDVYKGGVTSVYGFIKIHTDLQQIVLESLMNNYDRIDIYMNNTLQNGYVSSMSGLLNSHNIPPDNQWSKLN